MASRYDPAHFALDLIAHRFRVFPLHSPVFEAGKVVGCSCRRGTSCGRDTGKHPRIKGYTKAASDDPAVVRGWLERWPDANFGVVTGREAGLLVLDIDPRHGGDAALAELGGSLGPLPRTVEVRTGGGGRHLYFLHLVEPVATRSNALGTGVDVRADGNNGFVVGPGSTHPSGGVYRWERASHPAQIELAELPAPWMNALLEERGGFPRAETPGFSGSVLPGATPVVPVPPHPPNTPCSPCTPCGDQAAIGRVVERTLPAGPGEHDRGVFELARGLKFTARLGWDAAEAVHRVWFERALPHVSNRDYEYSQDKFERAWSAAKVAPGAGGLDEVLALAALVRLPPQAAKIRSLLARRLVPVVMAAGRLRSSPFPFSCHEGVEALRRAGQRCDPKDASRFLHDHIVKAGILECVSRGTPGSPGRGAAKWRLLVPVELVGESAGEEVARG